MRSIKSAERIVMARKTRNEIDAAVLGVVARFDTLPDEAHLRVRHVAAIMNCSVATVWRARRAGRIPAPYRLTAGLVAWRVGDLRKAWRSAAQ
jgi:prophage regulatory protein